MQRCAGHRCDDPEPPRNVVGDMQRCAHRSGRGSLVADVKGLMFQPSFEQPKTGGPRTPVQRDDAAAIKTYRYLRLGMVVIVVGLLASIFIQRSNSGCWQGSISAYYYTPARAIFVGGLVAIGASLIMIKGSTPIEDGLLNVAGALAPIVAFVPTSFESACDAPAQTRASGLPDAIVRDVQNNIGALLVAGVVAFLLAVLVFVLEQRRDDRLATRQVGWRVALLGLTAAMLIVGAWALASDRILDWHGEAAFLMFVILAIASIFNGGWLLWVNRGNGQKTSPRWQAFALLYVAVGIVMLIGGFIIDIVWPDPWEHRTLVLEIVEIALFGAIWVVQSVERWGKILQAPV